MTIEPNPFSSRFVKPGAIAFSSTSGFDLAELITRFQAVGWKAEIIGPHGCGKSTLLQSLKPLLPGSFRQVTLQADQNSNANLDLVHEQLDQLGPGETLIVDGVEQLTKSHQKSIFADCAQRQIRLLVTSHLSVGLPTLVELKPDLDRFRELVTHLLEGYKIQISDDEIEYAYQKYAPNIREALFSLYDVYENRRRKQKSL